ncbi:hypothetical protein QNO21_01970 [Microbacterium sp. zg-Y818]|uniref:hypothetical protein n=1 Tax=unclassified Microbacterium TaxID=2609290 RepID=UPI00214C515F|nr:MULTISPECIES: hypothetical protein [unclassified Microbacterium]MCR2801917.1 hypothetical protein [Microbacterium sp. zg.Y818]WIM22826.1 hypothetical protein QNO21_01970 [Microbacterium sp. zg-Y818]
MPDKQGKEMDSLMWGEINPKAKSGNRRTASIELPGEAHELWFEFVDGPAPTGPDRADPFLIATLLLWMERGVNVHVRGTVSSRLLSNLDELQDIWHSWRPEKYSVVQISADQVIGDEAATSAMGALLAFSGGLDAQYSLLRHRHGEARHRTSVIAAALLVHGFDVPLSQTATFDGVSQRAARVLSPLGIPLARVRSNFREIPMLWQDAHGLGIAAALHLFSESYSVGLIASGKSYADLELPWGSSPVTDPLLSSSRMEIRNDGSGATRTEKAMLAVRHPEAVRELRVCWEGSRLDRNCGACEKCARTYWNLRVAGADHPSCFDDLRVRASKVLTGPRGIVEWQDILEKARQTGNKAAFEYARVVVLHNKLRRFVRAITPLRVVLDAIRGR